MSNQVATPAEVDAALRVTLEPGDAPWTHQATAAPPVATVMGSWGPDRLVKLRLRMTFAPGTCLTVSAARARYGHLFLAPDSPHGPSLGHPVWVVQRERSTQLLFEQTPDCISVLELEQRGPVATE